MQHRIFFLSFVLLSLLLAATAYSAVELYDVQVVGTTVYYTLNTVGDITIEILPADQNGNPTGPVIYTVALMNQPRGNRSFLWPGIRDDGSAAPMGYYAARVTAQATQAQWDPIVGLFTNSDWDTEYPPRPLPSVPDFEGFYGIGINKNPSSQYYGRVYTSHNAQNNIFMYGPAGNYLGTFDDSMIPWGTSAPWDLSVADGGYVYVCDRTNAVIHCFTPDGNLMSTSPTLTNFRAIFARTTSDGRTHIFYSGGNDGIREIILQPDLLTWTGPSAVLYNPGGANDAYGMWVSPGLSVVYQACVSGPNTGVTRWLRQPAGNYLRDGGWSSNVGAAIDVDVNGLGNPAEFLWVTKNVAYGTGVRAIHKVSVATGATYYPPNANYDIVTWGLMCCADGVGNVAVTFGKSTPTWAQWYWGLFAEPGESSATRTVPMPYETRPAPFILPGTIVWTPDNVVDPDWLDSATVSFRVWDIHGWEDIADLDMDFDPVGGWNPVYPPTLDIVQDITDPYGRTDIVTIAGIQAAPGTRCTTGYGQPPHYLAVTIEDSGGASSTNPNAVQLRVRGDQISGTIRHRRVGDWAMQGAQIQAVGGGIPGATDPRARGPFTYLSPPADSNGNTAVQVSGGSYQVWAIGNGFGSEASIGISTPYYGGPLDLYLRPYSMAEARGFPDGTQVNIEGVCFSWPVGYPPTAGPGLGPRTDLEVSRNQWYICDSNDPQNGMLCLITQPSPTFLPQWDDPYGMDEFGFPTYIGERPALGDTIMYTGLLNTPSGYERRVMAADADILAAMGVFPQTINRIYLNQGDLGGLPVTPRTVTCSQIAQNSPGIWGQFVRVSAWVVGRSMTNPDLYTIADNSGTAELFLQTPTTLGITDPPVVGCRYTFTGAAGRTERYGNGCVRPRGQSDTVLSPGTCGADELDVIRDAAPGTYVTVHGIVTGKWSTFFYIENTTREIGVRVRATAAYVTTGDDVKVSGTVAIEDGEKVIVADPPAVYSSGNTVPAAFDLRTREVGGADFDANNPGVTDGRGALNVGLRVHVQGMVTARDPSGQWFYVWDGANRTDQPVSDGTGNIGVRIESTFACVPWTDWVDVTGIVSTDASLVPGVVAPTIIPSSAAKVTAFDTITTPPESPFRAGWNLIGVPAVPAGTGDGSEWTAKPWDPYMALAPNSYPDEIDGRLYRWENCTGGLGIWDMWSECNAHGPFGGLLLGDGYWLQIDDDWPVSYSGKRSSLDQWIGVCAPGWMILGHPKDWNTYLADVQVHTGDRIVSMYEAIWDELWIDCVGYLWDENTQGLADVGIPDCWCSTDTLQPWHGYWLQVYRGDLALIVPNSPIAP